MESWRFAVREASVHLGLWAHRVSALDSFNFAMGCE